MKYNFPEIKGRRSIEEQIEKVREEIKEFEDASSLEVHAKDLEALDILHAAETLVRLRFRGREQSVDSLVEEVITKNLERGKY